MSEGVARAGTCDALAYLIKHAEGLQRYCDDGRLPISNIQSQQFAKTIAIARKNFLFADTAAGAESSGRIFSLIETARAQRSQPAMLRDLMRRMRHLPVREQVFNLNRVLRGHYAYYGVAGNLRALQKVHRFVIRYWRQMLCSRSRKGYVPWEVFQRIRDRFPLQRPKLRLPFRELQALAVL